MRQNLSRKGERRATLPKVNRNPAVSAMPASAPMGKPSMLSSRNCAKSDAPKSIAKRRAARNPTESEPKSRCLGYASVSTYGQTLDAQLAQLRKERCAKIYREKASGAQPDRRELLKLLKAVAPGDVVTVTRIDRLARSTFDLFAIVKRIVDAGAQFRSLAEPWADTATSTGRLMIAVLGGLADVERDLIRTRTAEGRSRAKARGQHMGRPPKLTPQQQKEARRRRAEGATLKELAKSYNVGRATISRLGA